LDIDLKQVLTFFLKGRPGDSDGSSTNSQRESKPLRDFHKPEANGMQTSGCGPAECSYFAGAPQKLSPSRQRIDALRQPLEPSVPNLLPTLANRPISTASRLLQHTQWADWQSAADW